MGLISQPGRTPALAELLARIPTLQRARGSLQGGAPEPPPADGQRSLRPLGCPGISSLNQPHRLENSESPVTKGCPEHGRAFQATLRFSPTKNCRYREFLVRASLFSWKNIFEAVFSFQTKK